MCDVFACVCAQVCASVHGCVRVCAGMHECAWVCTGVCGYVQVCTGVRGYVRVWMGMRGYVWVCAGVHRCVCAGMHRCVLVCAWIYMVVRKLEHQYFFSNAARNFALKICQFFVNGAFVIGRGFFQISYQILPVLIE